MINKYLQIATTPTCMIVGSPETLLLLPIRIEFDVGSLVTAPVSDKIKQNQMKNHVFSVKISILKAKTTSSQNK